MVDIRTTKRFPAILLAFFCIIAAPCTAIDAAWIHTDEKNTLGNVLVSPDGSSVLAATGKVMLVSRNGTILAREPYGEIITQSNNGAVIVSSYSSVIASTIYLFSRSVNTDGTPVLKKQWETTLANRVDDIAVSGKGDRIALSAGGSGVHVYEGSSGNLIGHSDAYSSQIAISEKGSIIAGISFVGGLKIYTSKGALRKKFDLDLAGQTTDFLIGSDGNVVVFNTGPFIMGFNLTEGSELWKKRSSGDISMIAMTPSGNRIITGTGNGAVECYDANGSLRWISPADNGMESRPAVRAVALTGDGTIIVAGTEDGKVMFLDPDGDLLGVYDAGRHAVRHVAIASDGSLAVAAGDHFLIGFDTTDLGVPPAAAVTETPLVSRTFPSAIYPVEPGGTVSTSASITRTPARTPVQETPSVTITEYSVIRTATRSPANSLSIIAIIATMVFFAGCFLKRK